MTSRIKEYLCSVRIVPSGVAFSKRALATARQGVSITYCCTKPSISSPSRNVERAVCASYESQVCCNLFLGIGRRDSLGLQTGLR